MNESCSKNLRREDFQQALKELDSYIDVTLEDLMQINKLAQKYAQIREVETLLVGNIMTREIITVGAETPLRDAARILLEKRISGLPVVDSSNKLVGVVTEADFLTAMGIPCHHPAHSSVWHTLESMFLHPPSTTSLPAKVADIMATQVITTTPDKTLHDVIELLKKHHIKRVIVSDDQQQPLGIITRSDLVKVILQQLL